MQFEEIFTFYPVCEYSLPLLFSSKRGRRKYTEKVDEEGAGAPLAELRVRRPGLRLWSGGGNRDSGAERSVCFTRQGGPRQWTSICVCVCV